MAVIDTRTAPFAPASVFGRAIVKTIAAIGEWNDARATRKALSQLSDRELDDIGLCRGDIDTVIHHH